MLSGLAHREKNNARRCEIAHRAAAEGGGGVYVNPAVYRAVPGFVGGHF